MKAEIVPWSEIIRDHGLREQWVLIGIVPAIRQVIAVGSADSSGKHFIDVEQAGGYRTHLVEDDNLVARIVGEVPEPLRRLLPDSAASRIT